MSEQVNHPSHYCKDGRKECIVEMEEKYGIPATVGFCLMNAYKYLYRAGDKADNSYEQDRKKAEWYFHYANRLLEKLDFVFRHFGDVGELNGIVRIAKRNSKLRKLHKCKWDRRTSN